MSKCPSCREPLDYPSGDGCAAMTLHKESVMDDLIKRDDALALVEQWFDTDNHLYSIILNDITNLPAVTVEKPTEAQIASACLSYDHSFGLMDGPERVALMHQAREWFHAWRKEYVK